MRRLFGFVVSAALVATSVISTAHAAGGGYAPPVLSFLGTSGDIVGAGDPSGNADWAMASGTTDGVFRIWIGQNGYNELVGVDLVSNDGLHWDTFYGTPYWALGVTEAGKTRLLNYSDGTIDYSFNNPRILDIHVEDNAGGPSWFSGRSFYVTVYLGNGKVKRGFVRL